MEQIRQVELVKLSGNAQAVMEWMGDEVVGYDDPEYGPVYFDYQGVAQHGDWIVKGLDGKFRSPSARTAIAIFGEWIS